MTHKCILNALYQNTSMIELKKIKKIRMEPFLKRKKSAGRLNLSKPFFGNKITIDGNIVKICTPWIPIIIYLKKTYFI